MKRYIIILIISSLFFLPSYSQAASRVFWENFDDGNANEFDQHTAEVVGTSPRSGSYCGRANWTSTQSSSHFYLSSWSYTHETFIRYWIRIDENVEAGQAAKIMRLAFGGGDGTDTVHEMNTGSGAVNAYWYVGGSPVLDTYSGGTLGLSTWTKYEIYIKHDTNGTDGQFRVWVNDVLAPGYEDWSGNTYNGSVGWYPLHLPSNFVKRGPEPNYVYFDDVEIYSDQGTGATGSMAEGTITVEGVGDTMPPVTTGHSPEKGSTDVPVDSNIVVHIRDSGDGVDQSSIVMTVNGSTVNPTITGSAADYTVTYDPPDDFTQGQEVTVTIDAQDLYDPPNVMPQDSYSFTVAVAPDTTNPVISIAQPTSEDTYSTDQNTIALAGTASDDVGVTSITWANNLGGDGTASGITNWTISNIPLQEGNNVITVTAHDAAGNTGTDTLAVTYTPPPGTYTDEFGSATGTDYPGTLQDTFININTTNYSSNNLLNTYTWPQDKVSNAVILKWDLSSIPSSANVQEATLYLYLSSMEGGGGDDLYDLRAHKFNNYNPVISACTGYTYDGTNSWTPNTQCYNNIPLAQADIAPAEDTKSIDKTYGYKSWSVTNMVQDWVSDPDYNYGMLVNSDPVASSNSNRHFSSTEASNPDQRPKLVVTYTVGEEPDTTDPIVGITSPTLDDTYSTNQSTMSLGGTASDNVEVTSVTWVNNRGGSGTASGTDTWSISGITLHCGDDNIITVTANDAAGNSGTDTLTTDVRPCIPAGFDIQ